MKYKVINSVSKIETICDKVTIDGFDYYVSDEKPKLGEFYLDDINQIRQSVTDDEEYWDRRNGYKVIITCNNPNIDIPKVVDEVKILSQKYVKGEEVIPFHTRKGFIDGYNKSQETHPFSEEDMVDFLKFVENNYYFNSGCWVNCETDKVTHREELLQLWKKQKPKIVYYEKQG